LANDVKKKGRKKHSSGYFLGASVEGTKLYRRCGQRDLEPGFGTQKMSRIGSLDSRAIYLFVMEYV
jgi:hypothetical protein